MTIDDDDLNVVLDDEDTKAIAALTVEDIAAIDEAIVSKLSGRWQKTALVIAMSMYAYPDRYDDIRGFWLLLNKDCWRPVATYGNGASAKFVQRAIECSVGPAGHLMTIMQGLIWVGSGRSCQAADFSPRQHGMLS
jgi:hypothetical protein